MTRREFAKLATWSAAGVCCGCVGFGRRTRSVRFGLVTDCHYADRDDLHIEGTDPIHDRHYRESFAKLTECVETMNILKPDFLIELGDFKDKGATEEETLAFAEKIEDTFRGFRGARHHVLGNHDADAISKEQFLSKVSNHGFEQPLPHYAFTTAGVRFIVLDANFNPDLTPYCKGNFDWQKAVVPPDEIKWLEAELAAADGPAVVFCHHRLDEQGEADVRANGRMTALNAAEVRAVLAKSGKVAGVFTGHDHRGAFSTIDGIAYCTLPGTIHGSAPENGAFALAELKPDGEFTVKGYRKAPSRAWRTF